MAVRDNTAGERVDEEADESTIEEIVIDSIVDKIAGGEAIRDKIAGEGVAVRDKTAGESVAIRDNIAGGKAIQWRRKVKIVRGAKPPKVGLCN